MADRYGIWNVQILVTIGTSASIWGMLGMYVVIFDDSFECILTQSSHNPATLVAFSCIYGIFSGACKILLKLLIELDDTNFLGVSQGFLSVYHALYRLLRIHRKLGTFSPFLTGGKCLKCCLELDWALPMHLSAFQYCFRNQSKGLY